MCESQVVETVNNSPIHDYVEPDDHTQPTYGMTPVFKPFTKLMYVNLTFMYIWTLLLECTSGKPRIVLSSASTTRMTWKSYVQTSKLKVYFTLHCPCVDNTSETSEERFAELGSLPILSITSPVSNIPHLPNI